MNPELREEIREIIKRTGLGYRCGVDKAIQLCLNNHCYFISLFGWDDVSDLCKEYNYPDKFSFDIFSLANGQGFGNGRNAPVKKLLESLLCDVTAVNLDDYL